MTKLRQRLIEELRIRNRSEVTVRCYVRNVAKFSRHFGESPDLLGPEHIRKNRLFLLEDKKLSWSTVNQIVCSLRFLYVNVLKHEWAPRCRLPEEAEQAPDHPESFRGRHVPRLGAETEIPRSVHHYLRCGNCGYRKPAN